MRGPECRGYNMISLLAKGPRNTGARSGCQGFVANPADSNSPAVAKAMVTTSAIGTPS